MQRFPLIIQIPFFMAVRTNFVTTMPGTPDPSSLYFVGAGADSAELYVTTQAGMAIPVATDSIIQAFATTAAQSAVGAIVGSAPGALDTLEELAAALNDNPEVINNLITSVGDKANAADVYTKTESDSTTASLNAVIGNKANSADVYTRIESDSKEALLQSSVDAKADAADVYTKLESDAADANLQSAISVKADASNVYTKTESDATESSLQSAIGAKQDALSNASELAKFDNGQYDGNPLMTVGSIEW